MRQFWAALAIFVLVQTPCIAQQRTSIPANQLVREVVYNELSNHDHHGCWRYWIERRTQKETLLNEQVETVDGPVMRLIKSNGRPLDEEEKLKEEERLSHLLASPGEQARKRQEYADDEKRIGHILALLPDAFLYESLGVDNARYHLKFRPNPSYPAHSIEDRVFHGMNGELWIDARTKHLSRLDGHLDENVDFGYGILGRLYKGGWFSLQRTQVGEYDWKTQRLEVHMNGRAMLFKTIARETSETRGGFAPVPAGMKLTQGLTLLQNSVSETPEPSLAVVAMPW
jgi:hypothetical protein